MENKDFYDVDIIDGQIIIKNCPHFQDHGDLESIGSCLANGGYCCEEDLSDCFIKKAYFHLQKIKQQDRKLRKALTEIINLEKRAYTTTERCGIVGTIKGLVQQALGSEPNEQQ